MIDNTMGMTDATEIAPNNWYSHATGMVMHDMTWTVENIQPMTIDGIELIPKEEYHTTLVSVRRELPNPKKEARFIYDLRDFLWESPVEMSTIGRERYLCQKGDEATVIAQVHLFGGIALKEFVREYIPDYDPFWHVTLLKNEQTEHGIRISSREDLNDRCNLL